MRPRMFALVIALITIVTISSAGTAAPAQAAQQPTYDQYSRLLTRSAGQYWSGGKVAGQWAWNPQGSGESRISWGDPAKWPPSYAERFVRGGDWLLLDGWSDNGTYYRLRVTREEIGDGDCRNLRALPSDGGRQHYVQWTIPAKPYCLKAWGTITEESSGKVLDFGHTQIWSPPAPCSNQYHSGKTCVKQWESWWDNKDAPGAPIARRLERDQFIAEGIGMAFTIQQYFPSSWRADLRDFWTW